MSEQRIETLRRGERTIGRPVALEGFGFWTGQDVRLEFAPAGEKRGLYFVRTDLPNAPEISATLANRVAKPRQTSLAAHGARVDMVEHLLAALVAAEIDNVEIRINGPEIPGFDGSAAIFFDALCTAGITEQSSATKVRVIQSPIHFVTARGRIDLLPAREGATRFSYEFSYPKPTDGGCPPIPDQSFEWVFNRETFRQELARARTFLLRSEAEELLSFGLCQRVSPQDVLVFGADGPIDNRLRFENECARHKTVDLIGDFALGGCRIIGEIHAQRTGHQQNAEALAKLLGATDGE